MVTTKKKTFAGARERSTAVAERQGPARDKKQLGQEGGKNSSCSAARKEWSVAVRHKMIL